MGIVSFLVTKVFQRLMRVLDHDDRRIDHCANRNGNSTQRHDVGSLPQPEHRNERQNDGYRESDNRH